MAELEPEQPKTLREYYNPTIFTNISPIRLPEVTAHYVINTHLIQMLPEFNGLNDQNPYHHLNAFFSICATCKFQNVSNDVLRLTLFPFSLKDKAKQWLDSLAPNSITTWSQLESVFLKKYFPVGKTNQIRRAITSFAQNEGEQFHEAWERLKDLTRSCPHHNVPKWQLVQAFYDGMNDRNKQFVDASCGGIFMHKSEDEAWELFENLSDNSAQHAQSNRIANSSNKTGEVCEVNATTELSYKVEHLSRQVNQLLSEKYSQNQAQFLNQIRPPQEAYPSYYPDPTIEQVNALNNPNFYWGGNNSSNSHPSHYQQQSLPLNNYNNNNQAPYNNFDRHFQQNQTQVNKNNDEEPFDLQKEFREMKRAIYETRDLTKEVHDLTQRFNNHEQAFRKLEITVGQLATTINQREKGKLPSQPEQHPQGAYVVNEGSTSGTQHFHECCHYFKEWKKNK